MSIFEGSPSPWTSRMLSIFRIVAGLMFIASGTTKLFSYPPAPVPMPPIELMSQMGIGAILELVGGLCIVLGFLTRPVAFVLAGEMAVAYFQFHAPFELLPEHEQRHAGGALLLFLSLPDVRRSGSLEHRRNDCSLSAVTASNSAARCIVDP